MKNIFISICSLLMLITVPLLTYANLPNHCPTSLQEQHQQDQPGWQWQTYTGQTQDYKFTTSQIMKMGVTGYYVICWYDNMSDSISVNTNIVVKPAKGPWSSQTLPATCSSEKSTDCIFKAGL